MKASLQLNIGQSLTMTPQLQQAIRLLQLSTLDLQQEIQEAIESNPLLEIEEENHEATEGSTNDDARSKNDDSNMGQDENDYDNASSDNIETSEALQSDNIPDDFPVDTNWEDSYSSTLPASNFEDNDREDQNSTSDTLHSHLMWQMQLTPFSETDLLIAEAIIEAIDERGYLTCEVEDILETLPEDLRVTEEIEIEEVNAVLHRIQQFDPPGVGARNLPECLSIQLKQDFSEHPLLNKALELLATHSDLLRTRDYKTLIRKLRIKESDLKEILVLIQGLQPHPGESIQSESTSYVIPDVVAQKYKGKWVVTLNPDSMPRLRINSSYSSLVNQGRNSSDSQFIRGQLQEAKWFIKSLQSRNETLLKVSQCIVDHQSDFLDYGDEAMRPLVLATVADQVEMHESTISRVTTQKFIHTPRGIFELKYFFSSHVSTMTGGECSSTAIRALIKKLVAAEDTRKPLSDSKITAILADQGIKVARRTIAKYREAMAIPPSNERKSIL
jgi:RNA polymerase sigma-54 factor